MKHISLVVGYWKAGQAEKGTSAWKIANAKSRSGGRSDGNSHSDTVGNRFTYTAPKGGPLHDRQSPSDRRNQLVVHRVNSLAAPHLN